MAEVGDSRKREILGKGRFSERGDSSVASHPSERGGGGGRQDLVTSLEASAI